MRISFGRYIPKNSLIHKMDPRLKMFMVIFLIVSIFFPIKFTGYLIIGVGILTLFFLSKLNLNLLVRLLVPVSFIFTIILIMNFFFIHPSQSDITKITEYYNDHKNNLPSGFLWFVTSTFRSGRLSAEGVASAGLKVDPIGFFFNWKIFWFSEKALYSAIVMAFRIYLMITLTCVLTGTTPSLQLTLAIEDLLSPLKIIKLPVYILSMIISIALRMIPTLIDEAGRIMKAQSSRGIDIKNGKFKDKVKSLTSLIIPLLVSSFQKAEDLAYAMDARGYDPNARRTRFIQFKLNWIDIAIFTIGIAFATFMIVYASSPVVFANWHIAHIDSLIGR
ncbi:ABC transporter, permease component (predicted cobalt transport) [Mycoplasma yeatsii 13926]|uniref:ABC transporter, permease component (Predicted cobalt transport) n=1 Tax=Mycoplasma yeatsii 13926 TaxID=1188240 RepID=S6G3G2_9MOLU|nr:energy-coupling factor transporter transmembrane component T [Mycoplasma yeatsii]EOA07146.1 ABC transporter, permease component (predicted cobalt transport) [Mycoplasma yeatsii 13926]